MKRLFYPDSIAVFGVSESNDNFGRNIVKNLQDFAFQGQIYPIGTKPGKVYGLTIYTDIEETPGPVDLAVFLIPARFIPAQLETCGRKGIERVIISSGGFSELDEARSDLEQQIVDIAAKNNMRFLGPNCIAAINQDVGMCLPFVRMRHFQDGPVSALTQSGGVGLSIINQFTGQNLGINKYVSLGNKLNISEKDLIPFLNEDRSTEIICFYLEEIEEGREFMSAMRACEKPVVILKSNVEPETASVAKSHTAAVANDDRIVDSAFKQVGVTRARDIEDLPAACSVFTLPPMKGNRVAVITPTGGFAVILADVLAKYNFVMPEFPQAFIDEVSSHVRAGVIKLSNPLDLGDMFDFQMVAHTVTEAMRQEEFDALILSWILLRDIGLGIDSINIFPQLERMVEHFNKPVILSLVGDPADIAHMRKMTKFPIFSSPEESIRALSYLRDYSQRASQLRSQKPVLKDIDEAAVKKILDNSAAAGQTELGMEALEILDACGIPVAGAKLCATAGEAASGATGVGFPVAMKIASPDILHKTDAGGVKINLKNEDECRAAFDEIVANAKKSFPDAQINGVHVQAMVEGGARELLLGVKDNHAFGHVLVFGLGGIMVEALGDVSMRVAPIGEMDADSLLDEIRAKKVLGEFRGMAPVDRELLKDIFYRVSTLVTKFPQIKELDINPLSAFPGKKGCVAVDARIVIGV